MIIEFFIKGRRVDTYRCVSTKEQLANDQLCAEDEQAIADIKQTLFSKHGRPALAVIRRVQ